MLYTVTYSVYNGELLSHTSNSRLEIYSHYIDFIQRAATLAAMVPDTFAVIGMYDSSKLVCKTEIKSNKAA